MSWSEAEVAAILEQMRAGATVQSGGGRCHRTYSYRDGTWGYEDFDEGYTAEGATDEEGIRSLIAREPQLFRELLVAPHWRRFSPAVGIQGVAFADQLMAMAGETRGGHYLRAAFHEQAGDLAAAERDMLAELERVPAKDWHRTPFQQELERLRALARGAS
jgi:hypothetical protein